MANPSAGLVETKAAGWIFLKKGLLLYIAEAPVKCIPRGGGGVVVTSRNTQ